MNLLLNVLFGGQTKTKLKDLTNAKDFPPAMVTAVEKAGAAVGKFSPLLGGMIDMEAGFMQLDGSALGASARLCRSYEQETLTITSPRGDKLVGTLYPAEKPSDVYALLIHGYRMNAESEFFRYIPDYHDMGFNVVAIHQTGAGLSEGDYVSFGARESEDGVLWATYLAERFPGCRIFLHGDSLGAATVLIMTGKEDLPENVKFCIADSPYASAEHEFSGLLKAFHLPGKPLYRWLRKMFLKESGIDLNDADALSAVRRSKTPTLLIHGEADVFVFPENSEMLLAACAPEAERITYPGAHHCQSEFFHHDVYFQNIKTFADRYLT